MFFNFCFATAKDQSLYYNRENLINELIDEQEFLPDEVDAAMVWFNPIIASKPQLWHKSRIDSWHKRLGNLSIYH